MKRRGDDLSEHDVRKAIRSVDKNGARSLTNMFGVTHALQTSSSSGNFYILPREVLVFLDNNCKFMNSRYINLDELKKFFSLMERSSDKYVETWRGDRNAKEFNNEGYIKNEVLKLFKHKHDVFEIYPHLIGRRNETLTIPGRDVLDLPNFIMLYLLKRLSDIPKSASVTCAFTLGLQNDSTQYMLNRSNGRPITISNGRINIKDLGRMYMTIIQQYACLLPDNGESVFWNGSDESGVRVLLLNFSQRSRLHLTLIFFPVSSTSIAHSWTQQMEDLIQNTVHESVISVRNKLDNKCLVYCVIMALILKFEDNCQRIFGKGVFMVDSSEVYCKCAYMRQTNDRNLIELLDFLTKLITPGVERSDMVSENIKKFIRDIDSSVGTMLTVKEFSRGFKDIEKILIFNDFCGIDVYGMDFNISPHIYPLYISSNRKRVIELLAITPKTTNCSHYCVIINMETLLKNSGGKQFVSCSKCSECFFHRRLLREHKCPFKPNIVSVPGFEGYHYSKKDVKDTDDIIGICEKCRLCFVTEFEQQYHKEHCLMEGQTGYRHVQLVDYKDSSTPTLNGQEIDYENEENHVNRRRILYADFECSIDSDSGEHTFMSYGIYDWKDNIYKCGYDLEEFMDFVMDISKIGVEDEIYVYFHNAMGYDANFILRHILRGEKYKTWGIQVIMKSMNRLQKLVLRMKVNDKSKSIHIGDTFLFLTLSLEKIVDSIRKDDIDLNKENFSRFFEIFQERYPWVKVEEINHILRKNIFPYKFFDSSVKLDVGIEQFLEIFEPKEDNLKYFSERVTIEDLRNGYEDNKNIMRIFRCKDARDYHDLYLCCDVMQLSDVFNRSMNILWESHHIHLTRYLGMPSASWAAFLRYDPKMSIPLYENTFFAEFFKGMIRGGITSAALRHAVADERHSIIYLDVNGLYPFVMQKYKFPCGKFEFIPMGYSGELCAIKLNEFFKKCESENKGMCFCVDLHITDQVKQLTDMYPFAPEHRKIYKEYYADYDKKEFTPFLKKWSEANNGDKMSEFKGLVCTLYDKLKYNVHWRLLKFYMEHGVEVKKIWFAVSFDEGDYLKGYIRKNIEIRNTRKDELGKTLYKLLGNSIYGKTFESPFKRNTYEIVRDKTKLQGLIEEGNIAALTPIDDLGWIVRMDGEDIVLDKPTYIGACVCEFSKLHMYTLLYDKLMKIFPSVGNDIGCQLVYTDTDSFIVRVLHPPGVTSDPKTLFDYIRSKDPELIGGVGGQVKSETGEKDTIQEVIALRSKVYAYKTKDGHIGKRAKGTTYDAQEMQLDWGVYKNALESLTSYDTRNVQFVRKTFKITTLDVFRQSLSVNDGKRYICEDGIHTHAFGY